MDTSQIMYFLVILQAAIVLTKFFIYPIIIPQPVVTNVILYLFMIIDCSYFNGLWGKPIPISKNLYYNRMA